MCRTFNDKGLRLMCACFFISCFSISLGAEDQKKPEMVKPMRDLFSHKVHEGAFKDLKINCTECHPFSIKAKGFDPLSPGIPKGKLQPSLKKCHECHLGKINVPRPNQCALCHRDTKQLMPTNHSVNWRYRHGSFAQMDPDSCKECHSERSCTACHTQRDTLRHSVHRPGFRVTHSIEARANPQGCVACHSSANSCAQCHTKGNM